MTHPNIFDRPIHLGLGAVAAAQPPFTGMEWYADYAERVAADGREGRLVSAYRFTEDWDSWEMHPAGDEVVICLGGRMTLHQEKADGGRDSIVLNAGDYAINPAGCWHTADIAGDVAGGATALFITAGLGTEHRAR